MTMLPFHRKAILISFRISGEHQKKKVKRSVLYDIVDRMRTI